MAYWEHPDMHLDGFQETHPHLAPEVNEFVSTFQILTLTSHQNPDSELQFNMKYINALKQHATRPAGMDAITTDDLLARWVCRALKSEHDSETTAVIILKRTGHFHSHVNIDLLRSRFAPYTDIDSCANWFGRGRVPDTEQSHRKYLTKHIAYAIDPENSEEIDDAVSAVRLPSGKMKVWIHVADPSSIVAYNSELDLSARHRGLTVYLPDTTSHMYPKELSLQHMSLQDGVWCRALTFTIILNKDGNISDQDYDVHVTYIKVVRLTYDDANAILHNGKDDERHRDLLNLSTAAEWFSKWRKSQIPPEDYFEAPSRSIKYTTDYRSICVKLKRPLQPEPNIQLIPSNVDNHKTGFHSIVEDLMLLCGMVIAKYGQQKSIPLPYRHKHMYSSTPAPRYDLGMVQGYVQGTSPLRRYLDYIVHCQLKASLFGKSMLDEDSISKLTSSDPNKDAHFLLQRSKEYWVIEWFRRCQVRDVTFDATVLKYGYEWSWNDAKKIYADILIECEGSVNYITKLEEFPLFLYWKDCRNLLVQVQIANPMLRILTFKCCNTT